MHFDRILNSRHTLALSSYLGNTFPAEPHVSCHRKTPRANTAMSGLVASLAAFLTEHMGRDRGARPHTIATNGASFQRPAVFAEPYDKALSIAGRPSRHHRNAPHSQSLGDGPGQRCADLQCACPRSSPPVLRGIPTPRMALSGRTGAAPAPATRRSGVARPSRPRRSSNTAR